MLASTGSSGSGGGGLPDAASLEEAAAAAAILFDRDDEDILNSHTNEPAVPEELAHLTEDDVPEPLPGQLLQCPHCDQSFKLRRDYLAHLKWHAAREPVHKCKCCTKVFLSLDNLAQHVRTHGDGASRDAKQAVASSSGVAVQTTKCALCPKTFTDVESLQAHTRVHFSGNASERRKSQVHYYEIFLDRERFFFQNML